MHYKTAAGIQKIANQLRALRIAARLNKVAAQAQHEESGHTVGTPGKIEFPPPNPYMDKLPRAPYKPNPYLQPPPVGNLGNSLLPTAFPPAAPPARPNPSQVHEETHANGVTTPAVHEAGHSVGPSGRSPVSPSPAVTHEGAHSGQSQQLPPEYRKAYEDYLRGRGAARQQQIPAANQTATVLPIFPYPPVPPSPRPQPPYGGNMA